VSDPPSLVPILSDPLSPAPVLGRHPLLPPYSAEPTIRCDDVAQVRSKSHDHGADNNNSGILKE
jgi:hypothetical protein